jgi:hypothetical protein
MAEIAFDEEYQNGVLTSRKQRTISDEEIERRDAPIDIRQMASVLLDWANDAQTIADQATNVTQAQLKDMFARQATFFRRFRKLLIVQGLD